MPFIPVHDGKSLSHIHLPYVTWGLIAINVLVFFIGQGGGFEQASEGSVISFGLIPAVFNHVVELPPDFAEIPAPATLLTYSFLHGDFWHLIGNMVFLWVFADNVEDAMGHVRYAIFYLLCALGAGYAYVLSAPASQAPVVGASGAIAGVVAAYFMLHPTQKIWVLLFGRIPVRLGAIWVLGAWILFQVYSIVTAGPDDEVAWWSHVGGLVCGAILVLVLRRPGVPLFDKSPEPQFLPVIPKVDDRNRPL